MRRPPPPRRPGRPTPTSAASRARLPATAVRATGPSLAARRSSPSPLRLRCGRCRDLFAEFAAQLRQFLLLRVDGQQRHAAATQQFSHLPKAVAEETRQRFAFTLTAYRDFQLQFALRDHQPAAAGQLLRHRIEHQHGQYVIVRGQQAQRAQRLLVGAGEIADDADQAIMRRVQQRAA
ncbi:hypothetical protein G6F57_017764 [Rhizopus arrhizus]|nr:hypothetical protein G6F57_017764 [Rhizopus arrhizus]